MIDILMSTYNGARYLAEQIDSILGSSFADFRLMIRDDGSVDDTPALIAKYASADGRITVVSDTLGNLGASASFMQLLELSSAPYFMFADQDDVWLPDKIERAYKRITQDESPGLPNIVFTDLSVVDEKLKPIADSFWSYQRLDPQIAHDWRGLLAQNVVTGCTVIGNAAAREAALPFALPEMMHDHWVAVNAARRGSISYISEATVLYRQHGENAEGGHRFSAKYAAGRTGSPLRRWQRYQRAARHFGGVSATGLALRKTRLNLRRLFGRSAPAPNA